MAKSGTLVLRAWDHRLAGPGEVELEVDYVEYEGDPGSGPSYSSGGHPPVDPFVVAEGCRVKSTGKDIWEGLSGTEIRILEETLHEIVMEGSSDPWVPWAESDRWDGEEEAA